MDFIIAGTVEASDSGGLTLGHVLLLKKESLPTFLALGREKVERRKESTLPEVVNQFSD